MNGQEEHGVSYIEHKNPERSQFSFVLLVILSSLLLKKVHYLPTVPTYDYHHTVVVWWYLRLLPTYLPTSTCILRYIYEGRRSISILALYLFVFICEKWRNLHSE